MKVIQEVESALFRRLVGLFSLLLVSGAKQAFHFHNYLIPGARRAFIVLAPDWLSLSLLLVSGAWQSIHFCSHLFYARFSLSLLLVPGAGKAFHFHIILFQAPDGLSHSFVLAPDELSLLLVPCAWRTFHFYSRWAPDRLLLSLSFSQVPGGLAITTGEGVVPGVRLWHLDKWVLLMENYVNIHLRRSGSFVG